MTQELATPPAPADAARLDRVFADCPREAEPNVKPIALVGDLLLA